MLMRIVDANMLRCAGVCFGGDPKFYVLVCTPEDVQQLLYHQGDESVAVGSNVVNNLSFVSVQMS